jgi:hypothetical protein
MIVLILFKNDILGFTAVNACFPSMKSVFHGAKHRFHVEDPLMQLRGYVYGPIINDEVSYG